MKAMKYKIKILIAIILMMFALNVCELLPPEILPIEGNIVFDTIWDTKDSHWDLKMWTEKIYPNHGYDLDFDSSYDGSQLSINLIGVRKFYGTHPAEPIPAEASQSLGIPEGDYSLLFCYNENVDTYNFTITSYTVIITTVGVPAFTHQGDYSNRRD